MHCHCRCSLSQFYSQHGEKISRRSFKKSSTTHCLPLHRQFHQFQQTIILGSFQPLKTTQKVMISLRTVPLKLIVKDVSQVRSASEEQLISASEGLFCHLWSKDCKTLITGEGRLPIASGYDQTLTFIYSLILGHSRSYMQMDPT